MVHFPTSNELLQAALEENLYDKIVLQMQKDFALANISIDFSLDVHPNDLATTLHEKIYVLLMERFTAYLNLLYVIDVPEKNFKDIRATDAVDVSKEVSLLILKREWQKVWLKAKYSS